MEDHIALLVMTHPTTCKTMLTLTLVILNSALNLIGCTEYFSPLSTVNRNEESSNSLTDESNTD